ncbi:MAG: Gldg family protein [Alphaproteobacteria bacterium]|nr:Gldg family protein [Alphaproteobacteria bacterium]
MKRLSRRTYAIAAIVLAAIIFVALNIAADATFTASRIDLTENGQYTLSQGTKNIVSKLEEPVTLRFFFSKKAASEYAQVTSYATQVRDLLNQYAALSHGRVRVQEIEPTPFSEAEDQARANGLTAAPTQTGDPVYFGLVGTNTIDGKETIPFFAQDRAPFLEYDLSSLIYRLSHPKKPKLGILSGLQLQAGPGGMMAMMQGRSRPYILYQQLQQAYQIKMLQPNVADIPDDVDVLLIVQPGGISDPMLYAIDQFVMRGGRALVMVDPASELAGAAQQGFGRPPEPQPSDLPVLLKAWGVAYDASKVVGDRDLAQPVQMSDPQNPVQPYPVWLHLTPEQFNRTDQVTANLQSMNLASVGALSQAKGATTAFTPLVSSSSNASLLEEMQVRMQQPGQLMNQIVPTGHPLTIAARISGPAKTAFPKGAPPEPAADKKAPPKKHPPQITSAKNINVIVLADTDVFDDKFWIRVQEVYGRQMGVPYSDNAAFVLNAVENLTGSGDLISLRTRATNDRPFVVVQKLQQEAQAKFQQQAQALQQKLADTQQRLQALQQGGATEAGKPKTATGLTGEQQREVQRFQREAMETRAKLREVQRNLRRSIDELGSWLAFVNIALVPILVAIFAILLAVVRRRRRARALAF